MTTEEISYRAKCPACGDLNATYVCVRTTSTSAQTSNVARIDCPTCDKEDQCGS